MRFIHRLRLSGLLSFPPDAPDFELRPLNVLIGPNGAGKSNLFEALELLHATPGDFAAAVRDGGGAAEWLWKGPTRTQTAEMEIETDSCPGTGRPLRYRLEFAATGTGRLEVVDEAIEETEPAPGHEKPYFYYRFQRGEPVINVKERGEFGSGVRRQLHREDLHPDQSVLAQRKDPDSYPELTWLGRQFGRMQAFRDWEFGRYTALRRPQPADLPEGLLLPDARNLALVLNQVEHREPNRLDDLLRRFFPRYERMSTRISGGTVQLYLHEPGFSSPIPATRLSDGTLRFIALLVTLLSPEPPPLVCIEEPELGLHPDAVSLLADLMVEASERMQLVVSTHSDALVSALTDQPDAIVTCERPGAGTVLRRLDSERLAHWLDEYRLGDLWRMGELGANP